jgi:hypothetical protein
MKFGMLTLVMLLIATCCFAQADTIRLKNNAAPGNRKIVTDRPPQAVYFGIGGSGPLFSVNYDRRFGKRLNGLGFTAGVGFFGETGSTIFSIPASLNYLFGKQSHFLELAAGATYLTSSYDAFDGSNGSESLIMGHVNVGYRYQPAKGGFFARTGVSPLFAEDEYVTSFYLGLGYCF